MINVQIVEVQVSMPLDYNVCDNMCVCVYVC